MNRRPVMPVLRILMLLTAVWEMSATASAETLTVVFKGGRRVSATLDSRTDGNRLWLVFGNEHIRMTRGVQWNEVVTVARGDEVLSSDAVQRLARAMPAPEVNRRATHDRLLQINVPPTAGSVTRNVDPPAPLPVRAVHFDVMIANWDADVESDGLMIRPTAITATGESIAARGTLQVELWSMRRVGQDEAPRSRGRSFELVGQWSIAAVAGGIDGDEWLQLPFQANHPEVDTDWAAYGLVHIRFAVPGHGVFHHSEDSVRIRPYTPLRDALERDRGTRFFDGENRSRT